MSRRFLLSLFFLASACGGPDRTPGGTVRLFWQAVEQGNEKQAYDLLAEKTQQHLLQTAQLATSQTGGSRHFRPEEMITTGFAPSKNELQRIEVVSQDQQRATVRLYSAKNQAAEDWQLILVNKHWRIVLPVEKTLAQPTD